MRVKGAFVALTMLSALLWLRPAAGTVIVHETEVVRVPRIVTVTEFVRVWDEPETDATGADVPDTDVGETAESTDEADTSTDGYLGTYRITGYDPYCEHCCGKSDGITASGEPAEVGKTIAMKGVPFGTRILIDGLGEYIVQDRGVGDGVIDVACDGHEACYAVTGYREVWVIG